MILFCISRELVLDDIAKLLGKSLSATEIGF